MEKGIIKNRILSVLLALAMVVPIIAVGACKPEEVAPPAEWTWPTEVQRAGSPGSASASFLTMSAWSPVMEAATGVKWRVVPEAVSPNRYRYLKAGTLRWDAGNYDVAAMCINADSGYASRDGGPVPIRIAWQHEVTPAAFLVMGNSPIKSLADVKPGTRYPVWIGSPTMVALYKAMCAVLGMTEDEFIGVPFGDYGSASRAIGEGKADIFNMQDKAAAVYELAAKPEGIRWIDFSYNTEGALDPEGNFKRYREVKATSVMGWVPDVIESPLSGKFCTLSYAQLFTLEDTDAEFVYQTAKWLDENYDSYKDKFDGCANMSLEVFTWALNFAMVPVHEGTRRYLKERGVWTDALEARQTYNEKLVNWHIEAYAEAIDLADEQNIRVDPAEEKWMKFLQDYKKEIGIPEVRVMTDEEITQGLKLLAAKGR